MGYQRGVNMMNFQYYKVISRRGIDAIGCIDIPNGGYCQSVDTDWAIDSYDLEWFLSLSDEAEIGNGFCKTDVHDFLVYRGRGLAVAFFSRNASGQFDFTIIARLSAPQELWELLYPDTRKRAIAKARHIMFAGDYEKSWYFVGKASGQLYEVSPCDDGKTSVSCAFFYDTRFFTEDDGLDARKYNPEGLHFWGDALEGTDYSQHKLTTPEAILALATERPKVARRLINIFDFTEEELDLPALSVPRKVSRAFAR